MPAHRRLLPEAPTSAQLSRHIQCSPQDTHVQQHVIAISQVAIHNASGSTLSRTSMLCSICRMLNGWPALSQENDREGVWFGNLGHKMNDILRYKHLSKLSPSVLAHQSRKCLNDQQTAALQAFAAELGENAQSIDDVDWIQGRLKSQRFPIGHSKEEEKHEPSVARLQQAAQGVQDADVRKHAVDLANQ